MGKKLKGHESVNRQTRRQVTTTGLEETGGIAAICAAGGCTGVQYRHVHRRTSASRTRYHDIDVCANRRRAETRLLLLWYVSRRLLKSARKCFLATRLRRRAVLQSRPLWPRSYWLCFFLTPSNIKVNIATNNSSNPTAVAPFPGNVIRRGSRVFRSQSPRLGGKTSATSWCVAVTSMWVQKGRALSDILGNLHQPWELKSLVASRVDFVTAASITYYIS